MRFKALALTVLCVALMALWARFEPTAAADGLPAGEHELRIERSLACPQCTDLPVDVCDQDICKDMRGIIHEKVAAGESDGAIRQYFVQRYGARVLLSPPKSSSNLLAWLTPFAALAAGACIVLVFLRHARRRGGALAGSRRVTSTARFRARVEQEVGELE